MCKLNSKLKDGLQNVIRIEDKSKGEVKYKECYSISETLHTDYEHFKKTGEGYSLATYKGKVICLDIESEKTNESMDRHFEEDDFREQQSLWSNIQEQINYINELCELEDK